MEGRKFKLDKWLKNNFTVAEGVQLRAALSDRISSASDLALLDDEILQNECNISSRFTRAKVLAAIERMKKAGECGPSSGGESKQEKVSNIEIPAVAKVMVEEKRVSSLDVATTNAFSLLLKSSSDLSQINKMVKAKADRISEQRESCKSSSNSFNNKSQNSNSKGNGVTIDLTDHDSDAEDSAFSNACTNNNNNNHSTNNDNSNHSTNNDNNNHSSNKDNIASKRNHHGHADKDNNNNCNKKIKQSELPVVDLTCPNSKRSGNLTRAEIMLIRIFCHKWSLSGKVHLGTRSHREVGIFYDILFSSSYCDSFSIVSNR